MVWPASESPFSARQNADGRLVEKALSELPVRFREILVLRELEGLSYKEAADVLEVPIGTLTSRLARGREALQAMLSDRPGERS